MPTERTEPEIYMSQALELAESGLGRTWPNPSVGCVIVKNGKIIGKGRTADGGRPHAETIALNAAGVAATGASVYVTLEPCAHHGKTPPCAEALAKAQVAEVIIGCLDPDTRTNGKGSEILKAAGIRVITGILEKQCRALNKGFFKVAQKGLPYVMMKVAISRDGKFLRAGAAGINWVTGDKAREEVHRMRARYDAILTGTGTVLADDPQLNVRLPGMEAYSPVRVIIGQSGIPANAKIHAGGENWFYKQLDDTLPDLAKHGITRVMIEAGPRISNAMLERNLVDELVIFQSPRELGESGEKFFTRDYLSKYENLAEENFGEDIKITYKKIDL